MSHHTSARFFVSAVVAVTLAACSSQAPVAPGELISAEQSSLNAQRGGVPGVYTLSFWARNNITGPWEEVFSKPVWTNVVLKADVKDTLGNPATEGSVTFEFCSYGGRRWDLTQPDEAPKEACEQGLATWTRLQQPVSVENGGCDSLMSGSVCRPLGYQYPITVGLRFRFAQAKGTILSGKSQSSNFVWFAAQ
jgi:hypothetical protein